MFTLELKSKELQIRVTLFVESKEIGPRSIHYGMVQGMTNEGALIGQDFCAKS